MFQSTPSSQPVTGEPFIADATRDKINTLIQYLTDSVQSTAEFAKEQAPLVVRDMINWKITSGLSFAGLWVALFILVVAFQKRRGGAVFTYEWARTHYSETEGASDVIYFFYRVFRLGFPILCFCMIYWGLRDSALWYFGPKYGLLIELRNLVLSSGQSIKP